jgi:uncharacterized membrane protein
MHQYQAILLSLFCAVLAAVGQTFFKMGAAQVSTQYTDWVLNLKVILGMGIYGTSAVLFIVALKYGRLSILYPIIATSYIWVTLLSYYVFGENITYVNWIGVAMIVCGVTLITLKGGGQ